MSENNKDYWPDMRAALENKLEDLTVRTLELVDEGFMR